MRTEDKGKKRVDYRTSADEGVQVAISSQKDQRKIEIYRQIARHLKALVYLVAELDLGVRPKDL